jgi:hypothetical protein
MSTGGCTFLKAKAPESKQDNQPMTGGCIFKKASKPPAANCPVSQQSAGVCPISGNAKSSQETTEDLFKKAENMGGCPMFQASPEEAEEIRKEVAEGKAFMEAQKGSRCPMTGASKSSHDGGTGCPVAAEGDHPELEGTWMNPVNDDPNECPTFLPSPIIDAPKYAEKKRVKADDGLVWLEDAEKEVKEQFDFTLEKLKKGEEELLQDVHFLPFFLKI